MTNPGLQLKSIVTDPLTIAIGASVFLLLVGELLSPASRKARRSCGC